MRNHLRNCRGDWGPLNKEIEGFDVVDTPGQYGQHRQELVVETKDEWTYRFYRLREGEHFKFDKKSHPDGTECYSKTVPTSIQKRFEKHPDVNFSDVHWTFERPEE